MVRKKLWSFAFSVGLPKPPDSFARLLLTAIGLRRRSHRRISFSGGDNPFCQELVGHGTDGLYIFRVISPGASRQRAVTRSQLRDAASVRVNRRSFLGIGALVFIVRHTIAVAIEHYHYVVHCENRTMLRGNKRHQINA